MPQERTLKVKDYWHWRNYWASQTGNGKHDWIFDAQYTGDDGKVKKINTPNPKKGRDGEVIDMEPKLFSFTQREVRSQLAYQGAVLSVSSELNRLRRRKSDMQYQGSDLSEQDAERMAELSQAVGELNQLLAKKNPDVDKYEEIRQRVMGDRPATPQKSGPVEGTVSGRDIPQSTKFLMSLRPDPNARFDDSVSTDEVLDARVSDEGGVELEHAPGVIIV